MRNTGWLAGVSVLFGLLAGCGSDGSQGPDLIVDVDTGPYTRSHSLVSIDLPETVSHVRIVEVTETGPVAVSGQRNPEEPGRLYWTLGGVTPPGTTRTFHLFEDAQPSPQTVMEVEDAQGRHLEIRQAGRRVFRYRYGTVQPPTPDIPVIQARNAYIHPIWTPGGRMVSDDFAPDHLHQRGLWLAWTQTRYKDRTPDFWNLHKGSGTVAHAGIEAIWEGPVFAGFRSVHAHMDLSAPSPEKVLDEQWDVRVHAGGGAEADFFVFDISSTQTCSGDAGLQLPEYHYGGMAFRGAREWTPEVVRFLTSEGLDRDPADASRANWCLIAGALDDAQGGLVLMSHPDNFRSPQPLRIHPRMPYFVFSPQRLGDMEIRPGDSYRSHYRVVAFDGQLSPDRIQELWEDYAHPLQARPVGGPLMTAMGSDGMPHR